VAERKRPPYTSGADVEALFVRIRTLQPPKKVDTEWAATYNLAPKQPEAIPTLLKWLGIVDRNGVANGAIWDQVRLPQSRTEALAPLVRASYVDVFDRIDVEQATDDDLVGAFVNAYGMGDPRKQVRCFLVLCKMASIPTGTDAKKKPGPPRREPIAHATSRSESDDRRPSERDEATLGPIGNAGAEPAHGSRVTVSIALEIPADWTERQIRDRLLAISRALAEAGLGES
jgi:hypothetical protein